MNFKKINNIGGLSVFVISTLVYLLTVERTASYWDCGEFIAVSYKLMVPHPPGAPFFLLLGRMFSFFALGDVNKVAFWINILSVLSSSATIMLLFWTISMLSRKLLKIKDVDNINISDTLKIIGASAVGSLAYTFSDSFWFSAVEAEVYALSSFFTAFVFWAILKFELIEDESRANRWLILIAYMMGLSIGVHLLNLVTIPAIGLVYYFKKRKNVNRWGVIFTLLISGFVIVLINNFIIPGLPTLAGAFEVFFVNTLGLPFGSGALFVAFMVVGTLVYGIFYSIKHQQEILNTFLLGLAFILIGYSSYAIILIRSNYDTPINENAPSDIMSFVKYLKREQYGSRPLLYGQYYTAQVTGTSEGDNVYVKGKEKYEVSERQISYEYDKSHTTFLPRMYSSTPSHVDRYREVTGLPRGEKPSFADNIKYMLKHQMGWMYMRYFFWNFSGREGDWQDAGWLGIGDMFEEIPEKIANNKGRNNFFMIPLLLGIVGLLFQYGRSKKEFSVVASLFFLTGFALILYLNSPPIEPRERDYIYVGSYYAFAIWIGFSVLFFAEFLVKYFSKKAGAIIATVLSLTAPAIMAQQGWDDHDRSNRYFSVDSAKNFLSSVTPNAIFYTGGDNDTFPLWYVQDVEGFRTGVRVVVLSYYNVDWYIKQMMRKVYDSEPLPFTLTIENYRQGGYNDYLPYQDFGINRLNINQYLKLLKENDPQLRQYPTANIVPSRNFVIPIDKEKVKNMDIIPKKLLDSIPNEMVISLKKGKNALEKKDLAILDNLATTNWERPIYFNNTSLQQTNFDLSPWAIQEGNAFRIIPVKNPNVDEDYINVDIMYDNMINQFEYRELDNPNVYYSEDYRNFVLNHRSNFNSLVRALLNEGDTIRAEKVMLFSLEKMPDKSIPYDYTSVSTASLLYDLGKNEMATEIGQTLGNRSLEMVDYLRKKGHKPSEYEYRVNLAILNMLQRMFYENQKPDLANKYEIY